VKIWILIRAQKKARRILSRITDVALSMDVPWRNTSTSTSGSGINSDINSDRKEINVQIGMPYRVTIHTGPKMQNALLSAVSIRQRAPSQFCWAHCRTHHNTCWRLMYSTHYFRNLQAFAALSVRASAVLAIVFSALPSLNHEIWLSLKV